MTRQDFETRLQEQLRLWLGVPFLHNGRARSQGVDCLGLIVLVLQGSGLEIKDGDGKIYRPDWFLHTPEERYMAGILDQGVPVEKSDLLPGDVVFFRPGMLRGGTQMITHGGIYIGDGHFLHSITGRKVEISRLSLKAWTISYAGAVRPKALLDALRKKA